MNKRTRKRRIIIAISSLLGIISLLLIVGFYKPDAYNFLWILTRDCGNDFFPRDESIIEIDDPKLPLLSAVVQKEFISGQTSPLDGFNLVFRTDPEIPQEGVPVKLYWNITDSEGKAISVDKSIHGEPMHLYVVHSDLSSKLTHLHQQLLNNETEEWRSIATFTSGGVWNLVMQFAKDGTAYNISASVIVEGLEPEPYLPDFSRTQKLEEMTVCLRNFPEKVRVGEPTTFAFDVGWNRDTRDSYLHVGHNLIFALQNEDFIWNMHGDTSTERISQKVGLPIQRIGPSKKDPFTYTVTFPEAGLWLTHLEIDDIPVRFYIEVE